MATTMRFRSIGVIALLASVSTFAFADTINNFSGVHGDYCVSDEVVDTTILSESGSSCTSTGFQTGSTRILHNGDLDCAVNFFRDSGCNDFVRNVDTVSFYNACLTWYDVIDGKSSPNYINSFSYACIRKKRATGRTSTSTTMSTKAKRQDFPVLTNGSQITGGTGGGSSVTYSMTDIESTDDPNGTGVNAGLIGQASQAVVDAMHDDFNEDPDLSNGEGYGGTTTVDTVNVTWNIEAISSRLVLDAISLDAVVVMINEGLELAVAQNRDGFSANANGNNGNSFVLDVNFAKQ
jgi:hypothetical protein